LQRGFFSDGSMVRAKAGGLYLNFKLRKIEWGRAPQSQ
jgi:hypothetical protein